MSSVNNNNSKPTFEEWTALSSTKDVLFFNKKSKKLECMTYSNHFTRFFKVIWYYMKGYTRDSHLIFKGMENLINRSVKGIDLKAPSDDEFNQLLDTVKKVNQVTLPKMIQHYEKKGKEVHVIATQHLKQQIEQFLKEIEDLNRGDKETPQSDQTNREEKNQANSTNPSTPTPTSLDANTSNSTNASSPESTPLEPTTPETTIATPEAAPAAPSLPPPPPPPAMLSKEEMIARQLSKIEKQKNFVTYLQFLKLEKTPVFQGYLKTKQNLDISIEKQKSHQELLTKFSLDTLNAHINSIEEQIQKPGTNTVAIPQDGELKHYSIGAAKQTLTELKDLVKEIQDTADRVILFTKKLEQDGAKILEFEGEKFPCSEYKDKLALLANVSAAEIKANEEDLDYAKQKTNLDQMNNKLLELQGKPVPKKARVKNQALVQAPSSNDQKAGGLGAMGIAIAQRANAKMADKPDLMKLTPLKA